MDSVHIRMLKLKLQKKLVKKKKKLACNGIQNLYKVIRQYETLLDNYKKRINEIEDELLQHNTLENKVGILKKLIEIEAQYRFHVTKYLGYRERLHSVRLDEFRRKLNILNQSTSISHGKQNVTTSECGQISGSENPEPGETGTEQTNEGVEKDENN